MPSISRREFAVAAGATAAAGFAVPRTLWSWAGHRRSTLFDWRTIKGHIRVAFGGGGNAMVVRGDRGALLVDCKNLGLGATLRREAEEFGGRLEQVINTHHHGDHTGGNTAFTPDTMLVAHQNASGRIVEQAPGRLERLTQQRDAWVQRQEEAAREAGADSAVLNELKAFAAEAGRIEGRQFAPTVTVDGDAEFNVASRTIELRYVSKGHTDNDLFIYLPEDNVLHTGDLLFNGRHPFIDTRSGATTVGWQRCIAAMVRLCNAQTIVVPGHGEITDVAGLRKQDLYFETLRETVRGAIREGKSKEEILALQVPNFADFGDRGRERNLGTVYEEQGRRE